MRLSTAIALGRTTVKKWLPGKLHSCALGMAGNAAGVQNQWLADAPFMYTDIGAHWPWLELPSNGCPIVGCRYNSIVEDNNLMLIAHLFDSHVAEPVCEAWTLNQLIDFVRSIEPKEEDESEACNEQHKEVAVRTDPGVLSHSGHRGS